MTYYNFKCVHNQQVFTRSNLSNILFHSSTATDVDNIDVKVKVLERARLTTFLLAPFRLVTFIESGFAVEKENRLCCCCWCCCCCCRRWDIAKTGAVMEPSLMTVWRMSESNSSDSNGRVVGMCNVNLGTLWSIIFTNTLTFVSTKICTFLLLFKD